MLNFRIVIVLVVLVTGYIGGTVIYASQHPELLRHYSIHSQQSVPENNIPESTLMLQQF